MKNKILIIFTIVLVSGFFSMTQSVNNVFAQTQDVKEQKTELVAQSSNQDLLIIGQLKNQIKELQNQVAKLTAEVATVKEEIKITKELYKGVSGNEVKEIQKFLKQSPEIYPEGLITGYYGSLTEKAVKKFQEREGLSATGKIDETTRSSINEYLARGAEKKIIICHYLPENPNNKHSLEISESALETHLAHGDSLLACEAQPTIVSSIPSIVASKQTGTEGIEQVKCVFNGTLTAQKCHTADTKFTCIGEKTCSVVIKEIKNNKTAWTSSCGGSASTVMDGQDETIEFDCSGPAFQTAPIVAKTTEITSRITNIVSGTDSFCVLTTDNSAYCWTGTEDIIRKISGLGAVASITPGNMPFEHNCAVQTDGSAFCWGKNNWGQLGDGTFTKRETPALVSGLGSGTTAAITLTSSSTCALKKDGSVVCWGDNNASQLGDGTLEGRLTPVQVVGLGSGTTVAIFSYGGGRCAIKTNGVVVCWGPTPLNGYDNHTTIPTPATQFAPGTVKSLGFGFKLTCALKTDDSVVCSGSNYTGQAGNNQGKNALTMGIGTTAAITVGDYHSFALKKDGSVVGWGANGNGELGDGTVTSRYAPVSVVGLGPGTTAAIATTYLKTCALKTDDSVVCWPMGDKYIPTLFIPTN